MLRLKEILNIFLLYSIRQFKFLSFDIEFVLNFKKYIGI